MPDLKSSKFPSFSSSVQAQWAPVFLSPIMGSPERLVIAVAAVADNGFHVEGANALPRLSCLYGKAAETAIFAAEVAVDELKADIAARGIRALADPSSILSGLSIGEISKGEGSTVQQIAQSWMAAMSSLYNMRQDTLLEMVASKAMTLPDGEPTVADRLPNLIYSYVVGRRPGFERYFNEQIRQHRQRRRGKVHSVIIDFAGSHLVANFGTLFSSNRAASVDRIKRRIFDLIVDRDRERGSMVDRAHQMIVQHPSKDDPQFTERQVSEISDALSGLDEQAQVEEIKFVPMVNVASIGAHIIAQEAGLQAQY